MTTPDPGRGDRAPDPVLVARLRAAGCVFAEEEAELLSGTARTPQELAAMVERRVGGLPLEHVLGWAQFHGLRVAVEPGVFVPRRRTEALVDAAVGLAPRAPGPVVVLDLCCGSGALGLAVLTDLRGDGRAVRLHAADVEPAAVRCARSNLDPVGGQVYEGDLFAPLAAALRGRVDLLLANVPYVPSGAIGLLPPEFRDHEPRVALDGGDDGLDVLRRVAAQSGEWLAPGGHLLTEAAEDQASLAVGVLADAGLSARIAGTPDALVVIGTRYQDQPRAASSSSSRIRS